MTFQEALDLVNQVVIKYHGTRQDHVLLQQAMEVLEEFVKPVAQPPEE